MAADGRAGQSGGLASRHGPAPVVDAWRRQATAATHGAEVTLLAEERFARQDGPFPDERLALMLACAHPAIDPGIRTPLILQTILGIEVRLMASAFLVKPATLGQGLVRAKARIRDLAIGFEPPGPEALPERIDAVLGAIYAAYTLAGTMPSPARTPAAT